MGAPLRLVTTPQPDAEAILRASYVSKASYLAVRPALNDVAAVCGDAADISHALLYATEVHMVRTREAWESRGLDPKVMGRYAGCLIRAFEVMLTAGLRTHNPARCLSALAQSRYIKGTTRSLTADEFAAVLTAVRGDARMTAMIALLGNCGCRRNEIAEAVVDDYHPRMDFGDGEPPIPVLWVRLKRRVAKDYPKPLNDDARTALEEWLDERADDPRAERDTRIFLVGYSRIPGLVHAAMKKAGVAGRSIHSFRVYVRNEAERRGASAQAMMNLLGWSSRRMVDYYERSSVVRDSAAWLLPRIITAAASAECPSPPAAATPTA